MNDPIHWPRNEVPLALRQAPRCGARTRSGRECPSPTVRGKARCRMHGGARGSGGPPPRGDRNGNFKHGCGRARAWRPGGPSRVEMGEIKALLRAEPGKPLLAASEGPAAATTGPPGIR
jgi:glucans biosynthesis protein